MAGAGLADSRLVEDIWPQVLRILARFLGHQFPVVIAVQELKITLLRLDSFQRRLRAVGNANVRTFRYSQGTHLPTHSVSELGTRPKRGTGTITERLCHLVVYTQRCELLQLKGTEVGGLRQHFSISRVAITGDVSTCMWSTGQTSKLSLYRRGADISRYLRPRRGLLLTLASFSQPGAVELSYKLGGGTI